MRWNVAPESSQSRLFALSRRASNARMVPSVHRLAASSSFAPSFPPFDNLFDACWERFCESRAALCACVSPTRLLRLSLPGGPLPLCTGVNVPADSTQGRGAVRGRHPGSTRPPRMVIPFRDTHTCMRAALTCDVRIGPGLRASGYGLCASLARTYAVLRSPTCLSGPTRPCRIVLREPTMVVHVFM